MVSSPSQLVARVDICDGTLPIVPASVVRDIICIFPQKFTLVFVSSLRINEAHLVKSRAN